MAFSYTLNCHYPHVGSAIVYYGTYTFSGPTQTGTIFLPNAVHNFMVTLTPDSGCASFGMPKPDELEISTSDFNHSGNFRLDGQVIHPNVSVPGHSPKTQPALTGAAREFDDVIEVAEDRLTFSFQLQ